MKLLWKSFLAFLQCCLQTNRQRDRQAGRQTDRQRQTDRRAKMKTLPSPLGGGNESVFFIYDVTGVDNLPLDVYLTSHVGSEPPPPPPPRPAEYPSWVARCDIKGSIMKLLWKFFLAFLQCCLQTHRQTHRQRQAGRQTDRDRQTDEQRWKHYLRLSAEGMSQPFWLMMLQVSIIYRWTCI